MIRPTGSVCIVRLGFQYDCRPFIDVVTQLKRESKFDLSPSDRKFGVD